MDKAVFHVKANIFGTITNKKVISRLPKVLESLGPGVLEWWSIGVLKKRYQFFSHYANTPLLQYSEIKGISHFR
jgi:hypothetical protein